MNGSGLSTSIMVTSASDYHRNDDLSHDQEHHQRASASLWSLAFEVEATVDNSSNQTVADRHAPADFVLLSAIAASEAISEGDDFDGFLFDTDSIIGAVDTRLIAYPGTLRDVSWWEAVVKVTFYVILFVVSLVGNLFVVWTVYRNRTMRSPTTYYLVNLAVCDLMVTLLCIWVHLVVDLTEGWVFGAFFCKFSSFAQVLSLVSSILTLTLIACDRLFGVVCPVRAHFAERERGRSWPIFLTGVWLLSAAIAAPLLVYRRQLTRVWSDHVEVWCADVWPLVSSPSHPSSLYSPTARTLSSSLTTAEPADAPVTSDLDDQIDYEVSPLLVTESPDDVDAMSAMSLSYRTLYYTFVTLVLYFVPVVVMSLAYAVIVGKLWAHRRPGEGREFDMSAQLELSVKKKVIKMLSVLLTVFVVCWMPSQVTILYSEYRTAKHLPLPIWYHGLQYFAMFLAYTNSAVNPIIYTCFNENFRKGFRNCIRCRRRGLAAKRRRRCFELPAAVDGVTFPVHCVDQRFRRHRRQCHDCELQQLQLHQHQRRRVADTECTHRLHRLRRSSDDVMCVGEGGGSDNLEQLETRRNGGYNKRVFFADLSTI